MSNRLYNQFSYSPERQPINLMGSFQQTAEGAYASLVNQGITYKAKAFGIAGNDITIEIIDPGAEGPLDIQVSDQSIVITLEVDSGLSVVTDADALVAALQADSDVTDLIDISGSGSSPLIALAEDNLAGGQEGAFTSVAMNMRISQIDIGKYKIQLDDEFPNVLFANVSLQSSDPANLIPQLVSSQTAYGSDKTVVVRTITMDSVEETNMEDGNKLFVHLILRNSSNP